MSSGYGSLEEELEDCFFTAKTTFFRNVQSKRPSKVNVMIQEASTGRKQAPWSKGNRAPGRQAVCVSPEQVGRCPAGPLELDD